MTSYKALLSPPPHLSLKVYQCSWNKNKRQNKRMSEILKRQAKLRLVRCNVFTRLCCIFPATCRFYAFSTGATKEEDDSVICCSGFEEGLTSPFVLYYSKPLVVSRERFIRSVSDRNRTEPTGTGLTTQLSHSSATDCCFKLRTFSASPRLTLPPVLCCHPVHGKQRCWC